MKTLAVVDVETGGLDPKKHRLLEVAYALVHIPSGKLIRASSLLVDDPKREYGAEEVHGISPSLLGSGFAFSIEATIDPLYGILEKVDAISAYNSAFDSGWLPGLTIIDLMDFPWPRPCTSRSLTAVALAHGVGVVSAHRAIHDVLTTQALLERCVELGANLEAMIVHASRPKATYVSLAPFEQKDVVKAAGFSWFPETKQWRKRCFKDDVAGLGFAVREVQ